MDYLAMGRSESASRRAVIADFGVLEDTVHNLHASRRIYVAHRDAYGAAQRANPRLVD